MRARSILALAAVWLAAGPSRAAAPAPVTVEGNAVCPSPADVAARVAALLIGEARATPPPIARVDRAGAGLRVQLTDGRGDAVAQRNLPPSGTCAEMAEVVAVTITTWMTQLRPEWLPVPRLPADSTVVGASPAAGAPLSIDFGAGGGLSAGEGGAAGAVSVLAALHAGARGIGVLVRGSATTGRDVSVGARIASWRRSEIALGPSYQIPIGGWRLAASVGFSAGWLSAEGRDFPTNQSSGRFSPGAAGLLRIARPLGAFAPWLAIAPSVGWFEQPLIVVGSSDRRALHPFTVDALLGISVGRFP